MKTQRRRRGIAAWSVIVVLSLALAGAVWAIRSQGERQGRAGYSVSEIVPENRPELAFGRSEAFDYDPPIPGSYPLPVIQKAGDGNVIGPEGRPQRLGRLLEGKINVLSFIYTRCTDPSACPSATGMLRKVREASEMDRVIAESVNLITMSFDPGHDTPDLMGSYGRAFRGDAGGAEWLFLTTRSPKELKPILQEYGQLVERKPNPKDSYGPLFHTVRVYLIDRAGRIRNIYSMGLLDPRLVLADIRTLLLEEISKGA